MTFFKKRESSSLNSKVGQSDGEAEVKKREGCDVELCPCGRGGVSLESKGHHPASPAPAAGGAGGSWAQGGAWIVMGS